MLAIEIMRERDKRKIRVQLQRTKRNKRLIKVNSTLYETKGTKFFDSTWAQLIFNIHFYYYFRIEIFFSP